MADKGSGLAKFVLQIRHGLPSQSPNSKVANQMLDQDIYQGVYIASDAELAIARQVLNRPRLTVGELALMLEKADATISQIIRIWESGERPLI